MAPAISWMVSHRASVDCSQPKPSWEFSQSDAIECTLLVMR
jgi:hypothetical protein